MTELETLLRKLPIPSKRIEVLNNRTIIITTTGRDSADKWVRALRQFCTTAWGPSQGIDYAKENRGTVMRPTRIRVWRCGGMI